MSRQSERAHSIFLENLTEKKKERERDGKIGEKVSY